jgi:ribose transport system substrate-binding protein
VQSPAQESDKERQFALVQDVTAKGAQATLITPADSKGIVPALKQAQDKGILVINLDNRVDQPTAASAGVTLGGYVGADNQAGGQLAGEAMVKALGSKGKVAILEGIRGADNAEARKRGFETGIQDKLTIAATDSAEWDTQKAYAKFQSMLAAHPDLTGVFCANDKMALGALKAIQEAGRKGKISVIGYDNIPDVQPHLKSGDMYATIEQHPDLMGKYGVKMAVGVLEGSIAKGREYLVPLEVRLKDSY